jgi:hypothetical protein
METWTRRLKPKAEFASEWFAGHHTGGASERLPLARQPTKPQLATNA